MPIKLFNRKQHKTCVIGLDGVPHSLITKLAADGVMPRIQALFCTGRVAPMRVTLPEISSVSWSSFMTGKNPGEHGIFGFTDIAEDGRKLRFPSFKDLKADTMWDLLGKRGYKSVVINQPSTYPARPIPGALVSGFVAIELERSVSPPQYVTPLKKLGYEIDVDTESCKESPDKLFTSLNALIESRRRALDFFWKEIDWNLMEVVVTGTDRLHHFVWDAGENANHSHHIDFLDYYRRVDGFVGDVVDKFHSENPDGDVFILSDHGFCRSDFEVYINTMLEKEGFLRMATPDARELDAVTEDTRAFAMDPARIYIRRRGRFPGGRVDDGDVAPIKRDLSASFEALEYNGKRVVQRVFDAEEVYSGPYVGNGPDLLVVPVNGFDLKGKFGFKEIFGERRLQGMHTWDDAFFFSLRGAPIEPDREIHILEASQYIMRSLDAK
ncbi:MAG: hypothetical protein GTO51_06960 [Candidatus Latescibacteria bacterium]|nr:hypothetical protein [Candidatus Latescibacterota bacterium]NIM21540.1 hypothetical protein [Candidatus Latescibacterota bacterium]NIM65711.1 hypothetical protein [Candidatus Latescibacterota bacterium]NIO02093.1 hypothetical protein [Candidatus Latescibacterota bacterium]NIO28905.1 hypothetical protein [Candidatus Latescibacterota bacterium]